MGPIGLCFCFDLSDIVVRFCSDEAGLMAALKRGGVLEKGKKRERPDTASSLPAGMIQDAL